METERKRGTNADARDGGDAPLSDREREIIGMLAAGLSGAEIADELVLSPDTVRTHVRNAMAKLGASTRSHAVMLALQREEIAPSDSKGSGSPARAQEPVERRHVRGGQDQRVDRALGRMLSRLITLPDLSAGVVFLSSEDGLSLRRAAVAPAGSAHEIPEHVPLGDGPIGKIALNRRAAALPGFGNSATARSGCILAAPLIKDGRLLGVLGIGTRSSRPAGQSELLLVHAFANRLAEILDRGTELPSRLEATVERFATSWSATTAD